ncbi:Protein maelstrom, partial [Orchesella cincta]
KPPKNSYFFFINMRRERAEAEGYKIMGGFQEASRLFAFEWGQLSKEERAPYENMAKVAKEQEKYNINNKFTVTGETYAQVNKQLLENRTAHEEMNIFLKRMTTGSGSGSRIYIFMKCVHSVELLKDKRSKDYLPAEISMAAFTLKGGITSIYTTLVDAGKVPLGYQFNALENSEDTLLPLPGDSSYTAETRDYRGILSKIFGFTNHWQKEADKYDMPGHYRVFFCRTSEIEPIQTGLQWLVNQLHGKDKKKYQYLLDSVKIYTLSRLVLALAKQANKMNPSYQNYVVDSKLDDLAESVITKGNYEYRPEIACSFHKSAMGILKMHNCAQSIVMRRAFMLFEEFVPAYNYEWCDRHKIENVTKGTMKPMIVKKQEEVKPIEEVGLVEEPDWLKDEPKDEVKRSSSPDGAYGASWLDSKPTVSKGCAGKRDDDDEDLPDWARKPEINPSFHENDFPSLGGDGGSKPAKGRGSSSHWPLQSAHHTGNSGSSMRPTIPPTIKFAGRGRGFQGGAPPATNMFLDAEEFPSLGASTNSNSYGRGRGIRKS